jgi:hypothetical protein
MGWGMGRWVLGFCAGGRGWNHGVGGGRRGREERGRWGSEPWCWPVTACFPLTAAAVDSRVAHTFQGRSRLVNRLRSSPFFYYCKKEVTLTRLYNMS